MANVIPMRLGTVDNDGYNAFSIRKKCVNEGVPGTTESK